MKIKKTIFFKLLVCSAGFLFLAFVTTPVFSLNVDKDIHRFSGHVINQQNSTPIASAHIINLLMAKGTATNLEGAFSFSAREGDMIIFQALGFHADTLIISENHVLDKSQLVIKLNVRTYELLGIDVYPYSTYDEFKYAFLNFDHEDEYEIHFDFRLPESERKNPPRVRAGPEGGSIVFDGVITALYDKYSRRGKEILKTRDAEAKLAGTIRVTKLYSSEVIRKLTDIKDEKEIDEFLEFCSLKYDINESMIEYQIYQTILECFAYYKASK
jgi:hypothetical protein